MSIKKLEWDEQYSVGVAEIDNQHQLMFKTINELFEAINNKITAEKINSIIESLINYKIYHFATEEKYFKEFAYENATEHIAKHQEFNKKIEQLSGKYHKNSIDLAFELVDFLEDWLVDHLMIEDQKYINCFKEHGLK